MAPTATALRIPYCFFFSLEDSVPVAPFLKGVCIVIIILIPVYECFLDSVFWNKHVHMTLQNVVK